MVRSTAILHVGSRSALKDNANFFQAWIRNHVSPVTHQKNVSGVKMTLHEQSVPLLEPDAPQSEKDPKIDDSLRFANKEHLAPFFPKADPNHPRAHTFRSWRTKRKVVLYGCSMIGAIVLVLNVAATIYCKKKWTTIGHLGTIYRGDCKKSHRLSLLLHVVINVLSTVLLAASNLCMQLLSAPTRSEINKAHARYTWLDIGVPSFRNLWCIHWKRKIAVSILALSSIPLHFV